MLRSHSQPRAPSAPASGKTVSILSRGDWAASASRWLSIWPKRGRQNSCCWGVPSFHRGNWPRLLSDTGNVDSTRRKIEKIMHLETLGAEVLVLQADVAIQAELKAAVAQVRQRFGAIHGVIHAAGEVGSGLISAKTEAMVAQIFSPKVQGMRALQAVFKDEALDFMLLCSSLAAIAGGLSKVDYCAANAYLDAAARAAYREPTFPMISVNWDGWREVGMAANMALPAGVGIAPHQGVEAFERILNGVMRPQVIVSTVDLSEGLRRPRMTWLLSLWNSIWPRSGRDTQGLHCKRLLNCRTANWRKVLQRSGRTCSEWM